MPLPQAVTLPPFARTVRRSARMRCSRLTLFTLEAELRRLAATEPIPISALRAAIHTIPARCPCWWYAAIASDCADSVERWWMLYRWTRTGSLQWNIPSFTASANGSVWPACLCLRSFCSFFVFLPLVFGVSRTSQWSCECFIEFCHYLCVSWRKKTYFVQPNLSNAFFDLFARGFDICW